MKLQEIKEAYLENLRFYNELFPIHNRLQKQTRREYEAKELFDIKEISDIKGINDIKEIKEFSLLSKILTKKVKEFKERADRSGNAQVWRRGEPLDGLSPGLKERIEKALNFGT